MAVWQEYHQDDLISGSVFDAASTTQTNPLGKCVKIGPREFVYVCNNNSTAIVAGELLAAPAPTAITSNSFTVAAIGAKEITLTLAGITLDEFAGGYLHMTQDTGEGYTYRIESNTATSGGDIVITLKDELVVAIDATTDCVVRPNPYYLCQEGAIAEEIIGASVVAADGSSNTVFHWAQTKGPASVLITTGAGCSRGVQVQAGGSGGIVVGGDDTGQIVGVSLAAAEGDGSFQPVWLDIPTYS